MNPRKSVTRSQTKEERKAHRAAIEAERKAQQEIEAAGKAARKAARQAAKDAEDVEEERIIQELEDAERTEEGRKERELGKQSFNPFPRLPIEIRLKIWKMACFHGRNVHLQQGIEGFVMDHSLPYHNINPTISASGYRSNTSPPAVLQANRESRSEASIHYPLEFGVKLDRNTLSFSLPARTYINWEVDRICLLDTAQHTHFRWLIDGQQKLTLSHLKSIGVGFEFPFLIGSNGEIESVLDLVDKFPPPLEEILIFHVPYDYVYEGGTIELKEPREPRRKLKLPHDKGKTLIQAERERNMIQASLEGRRGYETGRPLPEVKLMRLWVDGKDESEKYFLPSSPPEEDE